MIDWREKKGGGDSLGPALKAEKKEKISETSDPCQQLDLLARAHVNATPQLREFTLWREKRKRKGKQTGGRERERTKEEKAATLPLQGR